MTSFDFLKIRPSLRDLLERLCGISKVTQYWVFNPKSSESKSNVPAPCQETPISKRGAQTRGQSPCPSVAPFCEFTLWPYWESQTHLRSGWHVLTLIRIYPAMSHANVILRNRLKFIETHSRMVVTGGWGEGPGELVWWVQSFSFTRWKSYGDGWWWRHNHMNVLNTTELY